MKKIAFFTGGRWEYGLLKPVMEKVRQDKGMKLVLIAGSAHAAGKFGKTADYIRQDGFGVAHTIQTLQKKDDRAHLAQAMGQAMQEAAQILQKEKPDCLVLLGDRSELFALASAALGVGVPIVHIHGGEITGGGLDEYFRHAISKMASMHLTATERSALRLARMGEQPARIQVIGSLGFEQAKKIMNEKKMELAGSLDLDQLGPFAVIVHHPISTDPLPGAREMEEIVKGVLASGLGAVVLAPNSDPGHEKLMARINRLERKGRVRFIPSLPQDQYFALLIRSRALVGNSSSGIIECAALDVPFINVSSRQAGRERGANVVDAAAKAGDITAKLEQVQTNAFRQAMSKMPSPYDRPGSAQAAYACLRDTDFSALHGPKPFYEPESMRTLHMGELAIGPEQPCFIIAEAGVNHNGKLELALKLVEEAKKAGADAVKFQTFDTSALVSDTAKMADYQVKNTGRKRSQAEMLKELELGAEDFKRIQAHCQRLGILFLSSPFDEKSVDLLARLGVPAYKVGSGELTNYPLLGRIAREKKPVILSTGMAGLEEVEGTVAFLRQAGCRELAVLQCTTSYPAPPESLNLRAMGALRERFGVPVGFSDHSQGILASVLAAGMGAAIIEKHFTLDRHMPGPDHAASLEPAELAEMVRQIRMAGKMRGTGRKEMQGIESSTRTLARKGIVAKKDLPKGAKLKAEDLATRRPLEGIGAERFYQVLGRKLKNGLKAGEALQESDIEEN